MPEFLITAPDGKKYRVSGPNRQGALEALKRKLATPSAASNTPRPVLPQPQPQQPPVPASEKGDISMGTAFDIATGQAESAATGGLAAFQRMLSEGAFGKAQKYLTENYGNPAREFVGLDPIDVDAVNKAEAERLQTLSDTAAEYSDQKAEETGFYNMTTGDINSLSDFVNFVTQKGAQAGAYMAPALASGAAPISMGLNYAFGTGEISNNLKDIEGKTQEEKDQIAASGGAIVAALEQLGIAKLLPAGASNSIIGAVASGVITEGTTEGLQELVNIGAERVAGKQFTEGEILERLKESAAAGGVVGGTFKAGTTAGAKVQSIFRPDGTIVDPSNLEGSYKSAAGDVARELQRIAKENSYNLKKVSTSASDGAKQALEDIRANNVSSINLLKGTLKQQLDPKAAESLEQLLSTYSPAAAGIAAGKKKVSQKVTKDQVDAIRRLVGPYKEGAQLLRELQRSNVITDLFKDGMKGGVSQFTDYFSPLGQSGAIYDPGRLANVVLGGGLAYQSGGLTLGIAGGGYALDKLTGKRSKVATFVKKNKDNKAAVPAFGPSIIAAEKLKESQQKDRRAAVAKVATALNAPKPGPLENIILGTGLDRNGVESVIKDMQQAYANDPDFTAVLDSISRNLGGEGNQVELLTEIIPVIGTYAMANRPDLLVQPPDNIGLLQDFRRMPAEVFTGIVQPQAVEAPAQPVQPAQQEQSPAYQAGIQRNIDRVDIQQDVVRSRPDIPDAEKTAMLEALDRLKQPLTSPVVAVQYEMTRLINDGATESNVIAAFTPILEAVTSQQRQAQGLQQPTIEDDTKFDMEPPALQIPEIVRGETTNIMMPNDLGSAFTFARDNNFRTGRDLKLELQQRSLDRQKEEGIDLTQVNEENVPRLEDHVFNDAIEALKNNENAIGWYDRTVTKALETLGEIYPEILTNPENKLQFIWALAVTSNGTKVDKNFELAADAYDHLQRTGVFPTDIGIGTAAKAINGGLAQYHTMLTKFQGDHQALADFMIGQLPVRDVEQQYGVKISGEGKDTLVRGASVLGPKIGNGFFANLYGHFDALTMDRWLMRTVGRMRGSLVKVNRPMVKQKQSEMGDIISNASTDQLKQLRAYLKPSGIPVTKNMPVQQKNDLAAYIARQSTDKSWREGLNNISNDMRLVGNALALYLDGQVEAPAGAKERTFIRDVFKQALDRLNDDPRVSRVSNAGLTMSDLQALLWYPEKRLYDTAKAPAGEESRGYSDDEAPDYANAARKLVEARKAMVVGSGLGPSSGDGPRGRGPALADAGRTVDDREPGLLPALREGRDKLGAKFSRRPQRQEVVDQFPPVKALFEIGKKGSPYENGITNLDQALELARALNITVHLFHTQQQMMDAQGRKNTGTVRGSFRKAPNGASGTVFALKEHTRVNDGRVSKLDELTTVLHEIFHGVTMGPMSGVGPMLNGNGNGTNSVENALGAMIDKPQGKRTREEREIIYEVKRLQDQLAAYIEGNPRDRRSVRVLNRALQDLEENRMRMTPEQQMQQEQAIDNYKNYIRTKSEFSVDPFWVYAVNPKLAKQVMPVTTKWIQKNLRKAGNKDIQFYSHPFAVSVAVMLAILAAEGGEQEEQEQQQPGALSPMPGMLTAA